MCVCVCFKVSNLSRGRRGRNNYCKIREIMIMVNITKKTDGHFSYLIQKRNQSAD